MRRERRWIGIGLALGALTLTGWGAGAAKANLLANPGFDEDGGSFTGWAVFGNSFVEAVSPLSGTHHAKMFGNFSGGFNVSGILQPFAASEGDIFELNGFSRHDTGDSLVGTGNWVVMKIAFFDAPAGGVEIGSGERVILDAGFATDVWHAHEPVVATAPAGTQRVEALFLFLQPETEGGAAFIDDAFFALVPEPASALLLIAGGLGLLRRRSGGR